MVDLDQSFINNQLRECVFDCVNTCSDTAAKLGLGMSYGWWSQNTGLLRCWSLIFFVSLLLFCLRPIMNDSINHFISIKKKNMKERMTFLLKDIILSIILIR